MDDTQRADNAQKNTATVMEVHESGIISDRTALRELQHISKNTGIFKSINNEEIDAADDGVSTGEESLVDTPPLPVSESREEL